MSIARLRNLVKRLPTLGAGGEWFADALTSYFDGAAGGMTLEQALGIDTPPCGRPWWWHEERERQLAAAKRLADLLPAAPGESQAITVHSAIVSYRRTRSASSLSQSAVDAMDAVIAINHGDVPSVKTVRRLLSARNSSSPVSCPLETCTVEHHEKENIKN